MSVGSRNKIFSVFSKYSKRLAAYLIAISVASLVFGPIPAIGDTATSTADATAQNQINANDAQIAVLNQEIATYKAELLQIGSDKRSLEQAINALDLQKRELEARVYITRLQINKTQTQIQQLGGAISSTQKTIDASKEALGEEMRQIQRYDDQPLIEQLLSAGGLEQATNDLNAAMEMKSGIQGSLQSLASQENDLSASQNDSIQKQGILTAQQKSLSSQQVQLVATEQSKTQLLVETNSKQSTYEKLLAQAEAQLNSFSTFAQNAGGSKLLGNQTVCDSWGCYYNQRDSAWGGNSLNGTRYTLASDGCLITSMAMVMTHYGYRDVTPVTINDNPSNFAAYFPAYLLYTINVDGVSATRKTARIDSTLAAGNPVIVELRAYGGTHFVVLVSGQNGNYIMRDPYIPNGNNVSFSSHYSLGQIIGVDRVIISG